MAQLKKGIGMTEKKKIKKLVSFTFVIKSIYTSVRPKLAG